MTSTLLLTEREDAVYIQPRRARVPHRLGAHLMSWRLDNALARGVSPDSSVLLSLRAHALIGRPERVELARALRHALAEAQAPRAWSACAPVCRRSVVRCAEMIEALARRVEDPGQVQVRGLAMTHVLLRDGSSPLYAGSQPQELARALRGAAAAL